MGLLSKKPSKDETVCCEKDIVVQNRNGLHARPAAMFVKISSRYRAEVWVEKDGERVNGKSIMGLMMLAAGKGSSLHVIAEGHDAEKVIAELSDLVESRFGED
jgi:phosphocarrier protein HPr